MARVIECDRCGHRIVGPGQGFTEVWVGKPPDRPPTDLCGPCGEDVRAFLADSRAGGLRASVENIKRILLDAGLSVTMDRPEHAVANLVVQRDAAVRQLQELRPKTYSEIIRE